MDTMDCNEAIRHLLQNDTATSMQALDAFGKVPAGVLAGNYEWLGDYDECTSLPDLQYCTINFKINLAQSNQTTGLMYGVCVPEVCSEDEIVQNIDNLTQSIPQLSFLSLGKAKYADSPVICQHFPQRPYDAGFICFTAFCLILSVLMFLGAALDVFQKYKKRRSINDTDGLSGHVSYGSNTGETNNAANTFIDETKPLMNDEVDKDKNSPSEKLSSRRSLFHEVLLCFAFNRNLSKLLDTSIGQSQAIGCLHGIRVISLSWVVLGHTFGFNSQSGTENPFILVDMITKFFFQAVGNAYSAVDSFFFMSGFLLSYLIFTRMEKSNEKISWFQFYFHRIWRITPLYMFVILFMIYYHPFFGDGPKWYQALYWDSRCEKYWWRNLLYINNFFPSADLCMGWSWYLACDMQFFIISPMILLPLFRSKTAGILISTILICASFVVTGSLIGKNHFMTNTYGLGGGLIPGRVSKKNYLNVVYTRPYARITPYLIGMILGYVIYKQISERQRVRLSPMVVSIGWALAFAAGVSVTYGTYTSYGDVVLQSVWTNAVNVIYGTFSRLGWTLALSWVVFVCYSGYGGWINDFLSWSFWIPLSRLTFSAYLVHGLVIQTYYQAYPSSNHVSVMSSCYIFCGSLMLSYAAAVLFSIAVEYPCAGLEKLMLGKTSLRTRDGEKKSQQDNVTTVT